MQVFFSCLDLFPCFDSCSFNRQYLIEDMLNHKQLVLKDLFVQSSSGAIHWHTTKPIKRHGITRLTRFPADYSTFTLNEKRNTRQCS